MKHTIILLYLISGIWISTGCRSMPPGPNRDLIDEAKNGDTAAIQRALDAGADINTRNEDGMTALMAAAIFNRYNAVKLLLDKGADKNLKDQNGLTALRWASFPSTAGDKTEIVKLLSSSASAPQNTAKQQNRVPGVSTTFRANANTDLFNAAASGDMAAVEAALRAKTSVKAKNPEDETALMLAAKHGHLEVAKLLIAAKADVNAKNCCYTPLILAAENGHIELVK